MGDLSTQRFKGPYIALERPIGVSLEELFSEALGHSPNDCAGIARDVTLDLADALLAAQHLDYCVGILSPGVVRVRPTTGVATEKGRRARASLLALPAIGRAGETIEDGLVRMPAADASYLERHPRPVSKHGRRQDLRTLGYLLWHMLELAAVERHPLRELASRWVVGRAESLRAAIHELETAVPGD
jgi:hypothetical protein